MLPARKRRPIRQLPQEPAPPPTLEQTPPTPPQVTYNDGQLTIIAQNATLSQVLRSVQSQTGASVEMPAGASNERVVGQLGPGQPRDVLNALLNGSKFNYIILGVTGNPGAVQKVILTTPKPAPTVNTAQNNTCSATTGRTARRRELRRARTATALAVASSAPPAKHAGPDARGIHSGAAAAARARQQQRQHAAQRRQDSGTVAAGVTADATTAAANAGATESRQPPTAAVGLLGRSSGTPSVRRRTAQRWLSCESTSIARSRSNQTSSEPVSCEATSATSSASRKMLSFSKKVFSAAEYTNSTALPSNARGLRTKPHSSLDSR